VAIHKSGGHVKPSGVRCIVTFPSGTVRTKIAPAPGAQSQIEKYNVVLPDKQEFLLLNHGDINVLSLYQEVKSKKERVS
jgi:hypothetical protein